MQKTVLPGDNDDISNYFLVKEKFLMSAYARYIILSCKYTIHIYVWILLPNMVAWDLFWKSKSLFFFSWTDKAEIVCMYIFLKKNSFFHSSFSNRSLTKGKTTLSNKGCDTRLDQKIVACPDVGNEIFGDLNAAWQWKPSLLQLNVLSTALYVK